MQLRRVHRLAHPRACRGRNPSLQPVGGIPQPPGIICPGAPGSRGPAAGGRGLPVRSPEERLRGPAGRTPRGAGLAPSGSLVRGSAATRCQKGVRQDGGGGFGGGLNSQDVG